MKRPKKKKKNKQISYPIISVFGFSVCEYAFN